MVLIMLYLLPGNTIMGFSKEMLRVNTDQSSPKVLMDFSVPT